MVLVLLALLWPPGPVAAQQAGGTWGCVQKTIYAVLPQDWGTVAGAAAAGSYDGEHFVVARVEQGARFRVVGGDVGVWRAGSNVLTVAPLIYSAGDFDWMGVTDDYVFAVSPDYVWLAIAALGSQDPSVIADLVSSLRATIEVCNPEPPTATPTNTPIAAPPGCTAYRSPAGSRFSPGSFPAAREAFAWQGSVLWESAGYGQGGWVGLPVFGSGAGELIPAGYTEYFSVDQATPGAMLLICTPAPTVTPTSSPGPGTPSPGCVPDAGYESYVNVYSRFGWVPPGVPDNAVPPLGATLHLNGGYSHFRVQVRNNNTATHWKGLLIDRDLGWSNGNEYLSVSLHTGGDRNYNFSLSSFEDVVYLYSWYDNTPNANQNTYFDLCIFALPVTATATPTATYTPSASPTGTLTASPTASRTPLPTWTPRPTVTPTVTPTATLTPSITPTATAGLPCPVRDEYQVPATPATSIITLTAGIEFQVLDGPVSVNVLDRAYPLQVGIYRFQWSTGAYTFYGLSGPSRVFVCAPFSGGTLTPTATPTLTPTVTPWPSLTWTPAPWPEVNFSADVYQVNEGDRRIVVDVVMSEPREMPVSVRFSTLAAPGASLGLAAGGSDAGLQLAALQANGGAVPGQDYVSLVSDIIFEPGSTAEQVVIDIIDDNLVEPAIEQLEIQLTRIIVDKVYEHLAPVLGAHTNSVIEILDNDTGATPTLAGTATPTPAPYVFDCDLQVIVAADVVTVSVDLTDTLLLGVELYRNDAGGLLAVDEVNGGVDFAPDLDVPAWGYDSAGRRVPGLQIANEQQYAGFDIVVRNVSDYLDGILYICAITRDDTPNGERINRPATVVSIVGDREPFKSVKLVIDAGSTSVALFSTSVPLADDGSACASRVYPAGGLPTYAPAPWAPWQSTPAPYVGEASELVTTGLPGAVCGMVGWAWQPLQLARLAASVFLLVGLAVYVRRLVGRVGGLRV